MRKFVIYNIPVVCHLTGKPKSSVSSLSRCFNILGKMTTSRRVVHYSFQDCTKFGSSTSILSLLPTSILLLPRQLSSAYPSLVVTRYKTKETIPVSSLRVAAAAAEDGTQVCVHLSEEGDKVWHMGGSTDQKPERRDEEDILIKDFRTHKNQWIEETGKEWPSACSTKDCDKEATVGAHVVLEGKEKIHLVPMCKSCNGSTSLHNWKPDIDEDTTGLELNIGMPCLELNHISKHESLTITNGLLWIDWYNKLKIHYIQTKTTSGPYNDSQLKRWVTRQRKCYDLNRILSYQVALLETIGFVWYPYADQWKECFALLVIYAKRENHCNVPQRYQEDGIKLGIWLKRQRQDKKNAKLDPDKEKRLDELGVEWNAKIAQWEEIFALLVQFKDKYGHCDVPWNHREDERNLGTWFTRQHVLYRKQELDPNKEKRLKELGVEWNQNDAQ